MYDVPTSKIYVERAQCHNATKLGYSKTVRLILYQKFRRLEQ